MGEAEAGTIRPVFVPRAPRDIDPGRVSGRGRGSWPPVASTGAGVVSTVANLTTQLGNVVAINVLRVARTAALVWPARAIHAFKRWAVIRFTDMFRL